MSNVCQCDQEPGTTGGFDCLERSGHRGHLGLGAGPYHDRLMSALPASLEWRRVFLDLLSHKRGDLLSTAW